MAFLLLIGSGLFVDRITRYFFFPTAEHFGSPAVAGLAFEEFTIAAEDGAPLDAWLLPARVPAGEPARGLVVQAHGNGGNLSSHWSSMAALTLRGFEVLMFDYRGYGRSPGRVTRSSAASDLRRVLDHARERSLREGVPLFLIGQSMGGALALEVAPERRDLAAVVVDSPFASWPGIAWWHFGRGRWHSPITRLFLETLFWSRRDPVTVARRLAAPLLVVSGTADATCPPEDARAIAAAVPGAREVVLDAADHVGLRSAEEARCVEDEIVAFLVEAGAAARARTR